LTRETRLEDVVLGVIEDRCFHTTRIGGGAAGAAVPVSEFAKAVRARTSDMPDFEARLDEAVVAIGAQRTNLADNAGYIWKLRRLFGRSTARPEDVYVFPESVLPPPYDEPY
jgi:hypothetical protein